MPRSLLILCSQCYRNSTELDTANWEPPLPSLKQLTSKCIHEERPKEQATSNCSDPSNIGPVRGKNHGYIVEE